MIDEYGMSYTELAASLNALKRRERRQLQNGTLLEWVEESQDLARRVYASAGIGDKLGYDYSYKYWYVVEEQLQKGGYRLAKVLNDIFS
jgi:hypothetical protein